MPSVLVTGANRGLGLEIVRYYLNQHWTVHACCRRPDSADELRLLFDQSHGLITIHELDVTRTRAITALRENLAESSIDVLINNAGVSIGRADKFGSLNYSDWTKMLNVNMLGPSAVSEALLKNVERSVRKLIVFVSSDLASLSGHDGRTLYYYRTSKIGLNMLMRTMAFELQDRGITSFSYHPGWIRTAMGGDKAPVDPKESAISLGGLVESAGISISGQYFNWKGENISW